MQHFLKPLAGVARARVVAAELLEQLLAAVHYAVAALDPGFGWIPVAPLARDLKSRSPRIGSSSSWHAPSDSKKRARILLSADSFVKIFFLTFHIRGSTMRAFLPTHRTKRMRISNDVHVETNPA
jgi:hypothetical protein